MSRGGLILHPTLGKWVSVPLNCFIQGVFGRDVLSPTVGPSSKVRNRVVFTPA